MINVLLIEDNRTIARIVYQQIKDNGRGNFCLDIAYSFAEGLALTEGHDVVLLDLVLPDSEGEDTFLNFQKLHPEIPIVVYTGMDRLEKRLLELGAQDVLVKADTPGTWLVKTLENAVARHQHRLLLLKTESSRAKLEKAIPEAGQSWGEFRKELATLEESLAALKNAVLP